MKTAQPPTKAPGTADALPNDAWGRLTVDVVAQSCHLEDRVAPRGRSR